MRFFEQNWKNLCADIKSGKPEHFGQVISDELRETITNRLTKDPERAAELTEIFSQGFESPVVPKIWKNMTKLIAFGGGSFSVYTESIKRYLGDVAHSNGFYMELGALVGTETKTGGLYALNSRNAFVEFVPIDEGSNSEAVFAHNVEIGKRYALLISTYSGLYRYRLDDVVSIETVENGTVYFSYDHNSSQTAYLGGASITEKAVCDGVSELQKGAAVSDFAYMLDENENGLVVLIETENDDFAAIDKDKAAELIEKSLKKDAGYNRAVFKGKIKPVKVKFMEQETQLFYRDVLMFRLNFPPDFIKPVRYINNPVQERFFKSRIIQ